MLSSYDSFEGRTKLNTVHEINSIKTIYAICMMTFIFQPQAKLFCVCTIIYYNLVCNVLLNVYHTVKVSFYVSHFMDNNVKEVMVYQCS